MPNDKNIKLKVGFNLINLISILIEKWFLNLHLSCKSQTFLGLDLFRISPLCGYHGNLNVYGTFSGNFLGFSYINLMSFTQNHIYSEHSSNSQ